MNNTKKLSRRVGFMAAAFSALLASAVQADVVLPGEPLGEEFQISQMALGAQSRPAIAAEASGNVSVVWQNSDGYNSAIYLRRYGPNGEELSNEILVSSPFGLMQEPAVAVDGNGVSLVVWQGSEYGLPADVYAQRVDAAGNLLGPAIVVNQFTDGEQFQPDVAMGTDGQAIVVWTSMGQDGSGAGVYARRIDPYGTPLGDEFQVNQYATGEQSEPTVAMYSAHRSVIAWSGPSEGHEFTDIHARHFDAAALPLSDEYRVNGNRDSHMGAPDIAADRLFHYYIVWHSQAGIGEANSILMRGHNSHFVSDSDTPDQLVYGIGGGVRSRPAIALDSDLPAYIGTPANMVVAWEEQADGDVYAMRFHGMVGVSPGRLVNTETADVQAAPAIAMDASGDITVAWQSLGQDGDDLGVYGQRYAGPDLADVTLTIQSPATTDMGEYLVYNIEVSNAGTQLPQGASAAAEDLVMDISLPEGAVLDSVGGYQWVCQGTGPIQCSRAEALDVSAVDFFNVALMAPTAAGPATLHASVTSSTRDESLLNNLASATVAIGDYDPEEFRFTHVTGVARGSTQTSNALTIQGMTMAAPVSITGGLYSIDGGPFTSEPGTIQPGQSVRLQHVASDWFAITRQTVLQVANVYGWFNSTTEPRDITPDTFAFSDQVDVPRGSQRTSNPIIVSGINDTAAISVSGGSYSVNGGAYTSANSTVSAGQSITVRHAASSGFAATTNTALTIGGVSDTFSSTTEAADTTPDAFGFSAQQNVQPFSMRTSSVVTMTGINSAAPISVSGGQYSIDYGSFTTTPGTVTAGQSVRVFHTAGDYGSSTTTTLTVGGVSGSFTSTALPPDLTPNVFVFTDTVDVARGSLQTSNLINVSGLSGSAPIGVSGGSYSINGGAFTSAAGTVANGQSVRVQHSASSAFSTATNTVLTIGTLSDTFTSTTIARDDTPDAFAFVDQAGVARGSLRSSNTVTIAGINDAVAISVTGGSYAIGGGAYTSTAGTISADQTVTVRHAASSSFATATDTVLTVGTRSDTFTSTTEARDGTPDAFSFTDQAAVPTGNLRTSNAVTVAGINDAVAISVTGGSYSINNGAFTSVAGVVQAGDQVRVQHTSAGAASTTMNTVLTIGGVSDTFSSTTGTSDTTPNAFSFTDVTGAKRNTVTTSGAVTIGGINAAVPISVSGGNATWSKNGVTYQSGAGTVSSGNSVRIRVTSSGSINTPVNVTVTIGGVTDVWTVTTGNK